MKPSCSRKKGHFRTRGTVSIELLLSLVPVLLTFLGICQLTLLLIAQLVVQHAATRAARAAAVILPDSPQHYDNAPRGSLSAGRQSSSLGLPPNIQNAPNLAPAWSSSGDTVENPQSTPGNRKKVTYGARRKAIVAAAYHPLSVLAPPPLAAVSATLADEFGKNAFFRIVSGRLGYVTGATSVLFFEGQNKTAVEQFEPRSTVRAQVSFLMPCGVPLAGSLICSTREDRLVSLVGLGKKHDLRALLPAVENPSVRDAILMMIPNLTVISAEATMPIQGARYYEQ